MLLLNSSDENVTSCDTPQTFTTFQTFFICYQIQFRQNILESVAGLFIIIGTCSLNFLVILILLRKPASTKSVFDTILMGHSIVDGLTGLVDIPFFHINTIFKYWPLGKITSLLWASFDNNINTTTNMHMLYMCWVRLRSIKAPRTFKNEFLIRKNHSVMILLWFIGLGTWIPITFAFGTYEFSNEVAIHPLYLVTVINFFTWFIPVAFVVLYGVLIIIELNHRRNVKKQKRMTTIATSTMSETNSMAAMSGFSGKFRRPIFGPQAKFQLIIISFWVQWSLPCVITLINPICNECINSNVTAYFYWLTYTVCFTDPIIVLLFNPNISVKGFKK
jgi:hypothetical protein